MNAWRVCDTIGGLRNTEAVGGAVHMIRTSSASEWVSALLVYLGSPHAGVWDFETPPKIVSRIKRGY